MIPYRNRRANDDGGKSEPGVVFFERVLRAFERAARAVGSIRDESLTIAGHSLRLHFAGPALPDRILPALAHLRSAPAADCDLRILVWDSVSTRVPLPLAPWTGGRHRARGDVIGFNDDRIHTAFNRDPDILSLFDSQRKLAIFWTQSAALLPFWETGSPLKAILSWWAGKNELLFVHAAAVGRPDGGVLIVGKGGTGKSTTAMACIPSSLSYCGDDYVLVGTSPGPHVYSLYNSGKLDGKHAAALPHITSAITNNDRLETEKALIFVYRDFPEKVVAGFPIRAILVPQIAGGGATSLQPTTAARALFALAPSTIFQLPGAGRDSFEFLSRLVQQVPCLRLELGGDLAQIPTVIADFLSRAQP